MIFGRPNLSRREETSILEVIRSGWLGNGPKARKFEKEFGDYVGSPYCVAVNSCTIGLTIVLKLLQKELGKRLVVATSPLTFCATANAVINSGNTLVFGDVKDDGTLDPKETPPYDVVIPVHYTGTPCQLDDFKQIIVEDSAHGFGGTYNGRPLGTIGKFGVFSFYPTKNITSGDGGMVVCPDKETSLKVRVWANQGETHNAYSRTRGDFQDTILYPGFKGAMTDLNATLGLTQLKRWKQLKEKRFKVFDLYEREFGKKPEGHSQHLYTIEIENRDEVRKKLREKGIPTGIHYKPLHLEPAYKFLDFKEGYLPKAERIGKRTLSLPLSNEMSEVDALNVIKEVKKLTMVTA